MCNPDDSGHCDPDILTHHVSPLQTLRTAVLATVMRSRTTVARLQGAARSGAARRARVPPVTPRWCDPRHCGAPSASTTLFAVKQSESG